MFHVWHTSMVYTSKSGIREDDTDDCECVTKWRPLSETDADNNNCMADLSKPRLNLGE